MAPPPIQLFLTTIASQITLRQRQEYILRVLQVKKIEFTSYDLASDEQAKRLWKRKAPADKQQLPGILVGGEFPGDFTQFEEAVEFNELDIFLRRNEDFKPFEDEKTLLRAEPIGVPGAYSPLQMYPSHAPSRSPSPSPLALREKEKKEINAGEELAEFGLANVSVTDDDLRALVAELGLGGDEADDLVKGLSSTETAPAKETKAAPKPSETKRVAKPKEPKLTPKEEKPPVKEEEPPKVVVKAEGEKEDQPKVVIIKEDEKEVQPKEVIAKDDDKKDVQPKEVDVKGDDKKETKLEGDAKEDDKKEAQPEAASAKEDDQKEEPKVVEDKKDGVPSVAAEASVPEETTKND